MRFHSYGILGSSCHKNKEEDKHGRHARAYRRLSSSLSPPPPGLPSPEPQGQWQAHVPLGSQVQLSSSSLGFPSRSTFSIHRVVFWSIFLLIPSKTLWGEQGVFPFYLMGKLGPRERGVKRLVQGHTASEQLSHDSGVGFRCQIQYSLAYTKMGSSQEQKCRLQLRSRSKHMPYGCLRVP